MTGIKDLQVKEVLLSRYQCANLDEIFYFLDKGFIALNVLTSGRN